MMLDRNIKQDGTKQQQTAATTKRTTFPVAMNTTTKITIETTKTKTYKILLKPNRRLRRPKVGQRGQ
jgi:hypothetical protein